MSLQQRDDSTDSGLSCDQDKILGTLKRPRAAAPAALHYTSGMCAAGLYCRAAAGVTARFSGSFSNQPTNNESTHISVHVEWSLSSRPYVREDMESMVEPGG